MSTICLCLYLSHQLLRLCLLFVPLPELFVPLSASTTFMLIPRLSTPPSTSIVSMTVSRPSVFLLLSVICVYLCLGSWLFCLCLLSMAMPESFALSSISFVFVLILGLLAFLSMSSVFIPMPQSFAYFF